MGNLKDKALETSEDDQEHQLTDKEFNYVKLLNAVLQYNTLKQQIMSGFLQYVATTRLGYPDDANLRFELDLDSDSKILRLSVIPGDAVPPPATA